MTIWTAPLDMRLIEAAPMFLILVPLILVAKMILDRYVWKLS